MNPQRLIAILTGLLTLLLALFSFILSFNALTDLAQQHGVSIPPLFPFVVEFAMIVFSLNALYRSLQGESAKVQWTLIIGSSLLAGLFNVAHANADWLSRLMAAMPSLFLLLSFESFLSLVKHGVTKRESIQTVTMLNKAAQQVSIEIEQGIKQRDMLTAQIETLEAHSNELLEDQTGDTKKVQISERREQVLNLLDQDMTQAQIADELGVSVATVKRDIKKLNGRVQ